MNTFDTIKTYILSSITQLFGLKSEQIKNIEISVSTNKEELFGDISCNASMTLAKELKKNPREIAKNIKTKLEENKEYFSLIEIAGPGFINITLTPEIWIKISNELYTKKEEFFALDKGIKRKKYLIEFVSANPTGPLHLGTGRGGIIGDVLANVLKLLGHQATKEFYINDTGNQIKNLAISLKVRCQQELGEDIQIPENGYKGSYLIDIAKECIKDHGKDVISKPNSFFETYAKDRLLEKIKNTLNDYGVKFDSWFSEKSLFEDGSVNKVIEILKEKEFVYEKDGALWFKSSHFGDDKDRVIKKKDGEFTYIASDIAYHKNKFDRNFEILVDILGQDHHGYVNRLKATLEALEFDADALQVILYQLVSVKLGDELVKMSKRAGTFTTLEKIIKTVGKDVARFFYLNRKSDTHLDFDLATALKKTDENPAHYIQYAYVRTNSLLKRANEEGLNFSLKNFKNISKAEIKVLKKIISLKQSLITIASTYQVHLIAYYTVELAKIFHNYYMNNRIIDPTDLETSKSRLVLVQLVQNMLAMCLDLLRLSKPEKM
ncbi:arginine--tRNA ligase [Candidatus Babeliales bacterium]|nr:arginine--tRNA ligase [Candidatus Babeliales bacterium]